MLLINYKHLHKAIDWLCKYYKTDVLGLYAASYATIIGNSNATVKELLNNPKLDGKPDLKLAQIRDPEFVTRGTVNCCQAADMVHSLKCLPIHFHIYFRNILQRRSNLVRAAPILIAIYERLWIWSPSR